MFAFDPLFGLPAVRLRLVPFVEVEVLVELLLLAPDEEEEDGDGLSR